MALQLTDCQWTAILGAETGSASPLFLLPFILTVSVARAFTKVDFLESAVTLSWQRGQQYFPVLTDTRIIWTPLCTTVGLWVHTLIWNLIPTDLWTQLFSFHTPSLLVLSQWLNANRHSPWMSFYWCCYFSCPFVQWMFVSYKLWNEMRWDENSKY